MPGTRIAWDGGIQVATDSYGGEFDPAVVTPPLVLSKRVIKAWSIDSVTQSGTQFTPVGAEAAAPYARHRIRVGGKDVTYFRGIETPFPEYGLQSPLLYGSGILTFPQINASYERAGHGSLSWLKKFGRVVIERVDDSGTVVATDFRGIVADHRHDGPTFSCTIAGEATGPANMMDRPGIPFPGSVDIGTQVLNCVQRRLRLAVGNAPTTGIVFPESGGNGSELDFITDLLARSTTLGGSQWTVMPNAKGVYRMFRKDVTTKDATLYPDGARVVASLRRDFTEEPTRVWGSAILDNGMRFLNAKYPGYAGDARPDFPGTLNPGDSGDGVLALKWQLFIAGYLDDPSGDWTTDGDDPITQAVEDLQEDAGLSQTGVVNNSTWNAAFSADVGFHLRGAFIAPLSAASFTQAYLRNGLGQIIGENPDFDKTIPPVDATLAMGRVRTIQQARQFARQKRADATVSNWVGTITVYAGAVIDGEHNPGDDLTSDLVRDARSIKPGMNLWLPTWDNGTLIHVSGVSVQATGAVEFSVDTRARDALEVFAIRERNRESRINASRSPMAQRRRSALRDDTGAFYDGGPFGKIVRTFCPADTWTVVESPAGRSGTLQRIDLQTDTDEAAFGLWIGGADISTSWMDRKVGDPFDTDFPDHVERNQKTWEESHGLLDIWGSKDQPCGYWPRSHTNAAGETDAPITGQFVFKAGAIYATSGIGGILRLAIRPDRDTYVQGGRVLTLLLDDAAG